MNQPPNIDLSDETIAIIVREASRAGKSPNDWLMGILRIFPSGPPAIDFDDPGSGGPAVLSAEEKRRADRERLKSFIGCISMPEAVGADNDQIDADIAAFIDDNHENS